MVEFRYMKGAVYVLENVKADRIKVGMTTGNVRDRLNDVNDIWGGMKVTCQICGGRRLSGSSGLIPRHQTNGISCPGGGKLPLEKDITTAEAYLDELKKEKQDLNGGNKSAVTRKINNLSKRIDLFRRYTYPVGIWEFKKAYYTECAENVELLSHELLSNYLDESAVIGEVFNCSVVEASKAIEDVLKDLNLSDAVRIDIRDDTQSELYGSCSICGGDLTREGSCRSCIKRFFHDT